MTDNLVTEPEAPYTIDPNKSYFEQLVGENAKFKDQEALAKSKYESDTYIKILERQLDRTNAGWQQDREENSTRAKLQDLLDKLSNTSLTPTTPETSEKPPIDLTQIESLVSSKMDARDKTRKEEENFSRVQKELTERFGNKLNDHLKEIGLDGKSAAQIAKTNPDLILKALGTAQQQQQYQAPPRNSSGFTPNPPQKRTWSYYDSMFQKNPKLYNDPKINIQMQKDYLALGTEFEDGTFRKYGDGISPI